MELHRTGPRKVEAAIVALVQAMHANDPSVNIDAAQKSIKAVAMRGRIGGPRERDDTRSVTVGEMLDATFNGAKVPAGIQHSMAPSEFQGQIWPALRKTREKVHG